MSNLQIFKDTVIIITKLFLLKKVKVYNNHDIVDYELQSYVIAYNVRTFKNEISKFSKENDWYTLII